MNFKFNKKEIAKLKYRCTQSVTSLLGSGSYRYIDKGSDVLAIAHVDIHPSVQKYQNRFRTTQDKIFSPALDDRLGVYIILDVLPRMGINVDVLLTTDEEIGRSTAAEFTSNKQYNWMFQFDRHGTGVVMYEYETDGLRDLMESYGFPVGIGSFSDICYLNDLMCTGFNFGTGYDNEHTLGCFAIKRDVETQLRLFWDFFVDNQYSLMPFDPSEYYAMEWEYIDAVDWKKDKEYDVYDCNLCGSVKDVQYYKGVDSYICDECLFIIPGDEFDLF